MANHCYNSVTFTGDMEQLKKLEKRLKKTQENCFKEAYTDQGLPIPTTVSDENSVWLNGANYHFILFKKTDNWTDSSEDVYDKYGSKWFEPYWSFDEDTLQMWGDSAWSPMMPLFMKICKFYKLNASGFYSEPGMNFAGDFEMNEAGMMQHIPATYRAHLAKNNPEVFWDDILVWISEGYYEKLDAIFADFKEVDWELTPSEIETLEEAFKDFQNLPTP